MISHGSIIHQKNPASSVGTLMLITVPGMMMYLQTLELCTSQMDGSAVKGSAKRRFSNARLYQKTHSYYKADWLLFCNCIDIGIHAMSSAVPLSKRVEAICDLINRAEAEAVHTRVVRKREITRMNAQVKQLLQKCT